MGGCVSRESEEEKDMNAVIGVKADLDKTKIKLLLLGAGESGKSTIFKQMKIVYGKPSVVHQGELTLLRSVIHNNAISTMQTILEYCEMFELKGLCAPEVLRAFEQVSSADENDEIDPKLGRAIALLWADRGVQATWERRSEFQVVESMKYFISKMERISRPEYMNREDGSYTVEDRREYQQDALLARVRTSGILVEQYEIGGRTFELYDVGGQRNERRKWIHCFENVTAVIFVAAISEYNQKLFEDATTNRMLEALEIFEEINANKFFFKAAMILFLNKKDLYEDKIRRFDIKHSPGFADYTGGCDYEKGTQYFLKKFMDRKGDANKQIYYHITCATDTTQVKTILNSCIMIIVSRNMEKSGFM